MLVNHFKNSSQYSPGRFNHRIAVNRVAPHALEYHLNGATNVELVVKLRVCARRLDVGVEFTQTREEIHPRVIVVDNLVEECLRRRVDQRTD